VPDCSGERTALFSSQEAVFDGDNTEPMEQIEPTGSFEVLRMS
jgi:hypothetical protein